MLPLSCTCSLAREDVSYPDFGGAKAQRRLNVSTKILAAGHFNRSLLYYVWRLSFQHHTMRAQATRIVMSTRFQYPHMGRILAALVMLRLFNT